MQYCLLGGIRQLAQASHARHAKVKPDEPFAPLNIKSRYAGSFTAQGPSGPGQLLPILIITPGRAGPLGALEL